MPLNRVNEIMTLIHRKLGHSGLGHCPPMSAGAVIAARQLRRLHQLATGLPGSPRAPAPQAAPRISEHLATRDSSPVSCANARMHPSRNWAVGDRIRTGLCFEFSDN